MLKKFKEKSSGFYYYKFGISYINLLEFIIFYILFIYTLYLLILYFLMMRMISMIVLRIQQKENLIVKVIL